VGRGCWRFARMNPNQSPNIGAVIPKLGIRHIRSLLTSANQGWSIPSPDPELQGFQESRSSFRANVGCCQCSVNGIPSANVIAWRSRESHVGGQVATFQFVGGHLATRLAHPFIRLVPPSPRPPVPSPIRPSVRPCIHLTVLSLA
jgi:hypothetical protein